MVGTLPTDQRLGHRLCADVHSAIAPFQSKAKPVHLYSVEPYQLQLIKESGFRIA